MFHIQKLFNDITAIHDVYLLSTTMLWVKALKTFYSFLTTAHHVYN